MDKLPAHKFLKEWFAKRRAHDQARVVQLRQLAKLPIKEAVVLPKTKVKVLKKIVRPLKPWHGRKGLVKIAAQKVGGSAFRDGSAFTQALVSRRGFTLLGSGCYGSVLKHPTSDKVLKVIHRPKSDGWPAYVKWATDTGFAGSFAPLVYSYKYIPQGDFAIASMEKLDKTLGELKNRHSHDVTIKYDLFTSGIERFAVEGAPEPSPLMRKLLDTAEPGLAEFRDQFIKQFPGGYDMHYGNAMTRGNQLVITDPICSANNSSVAGKLRWKHAA